MKLCFLRPFCVLLVIAPLAANAGSAGVPDATTPPIVGRISPGQIEQILAQARSEQSAAGLSSGLKQDGSVLAGVLAIFQKNYSGWGGLIRNVQITAPAVSHQIANIKKRLGKDLVPKEASDVSEMAAATENCIEYLSSPYLVSGMSPDVAQVTRQSAQATLRKMNDQSVSTSGLALSPMLGRTRDHLAQASQVAENRAQIPAAVDAINFTETALDQGNLKAAIQQWTALTGGRLPQFQFTAQYVAWNQSLFADLILLDSCTSQLKSWQSNQTKAARVQELLLVHSCRSTAAQKANTTAFLDKIQPSIEQEVARDFGSLPSDAELKKFLSDAETQQRAPAQAADVRQSVPVQQPRAHETTAVSAESEVESDEAGASDDPAPAPDKISPSPRRKAAPATSQESVAQTYSPEPQRTSSAPRWDLSVWSPYLTVLLIIGFVVLLCFAPVYAILLGIVCAIAVAAGDGLPAIPAFAVYEFAGFVWAVIKRSRRRRRDRELEAKWKKEVEQSQREQEAERRKLERERLFSTGAYGEVAKKFIGLLSCCSSPWDELMKTANAMRGSDSAVSFKTAAWHDVLQILKAMSVANGETTNDLARILQAFLAEIEPDKWPSLEECREKINDRDAKPVALPMTIPLLQGYDGVRRTHLAADAASTYESLVVAAAGNSSNSFAVEAVRSSYLALLRPYVAGGSSPGGGNASAHKETEPKGFADDCALLGVNAAFTAEELSEARRRKVTQWHSDQLHGMAPELREFADQQLALINAAYDRLRPRAKSASA